jgi:hypothetical protein
LVTGEDATLHIIAAADIGIALKLVVLVCVDLRRCHTTSNEKSAQKLFNAQAGAGPAAVARARATQSIAGPQTTHCTPLE